MKMQERNDGERLFRGGTVAVEEQDHLIPVGDMRLKVGGENANRAVA